MSRVVSTFRAGKCVYDGNRVRPVSGRGTLTVSEEQGLVTFEWKPRAGNSADADPVISVFGDAEWKEVPQCTNGRVYVLDFTAGRNTHFYWMQEPSTKKDEDYFKAINKAINPAWRPNVSGEAGGGSTVNSGAAAAAGGVTSSTAATDAAAQRDALQAAVAALLGPQGAAGSASSGGDRPGVSLDDVLGQPAFAAAVRDLDTDAAIAAVREHLPQTQLPEREELRASVTSSAFREATQMLAAAAEDPTAVRTIESSFGLSSGSGSGANIPAFGAPRTPAELLLTAVHRSVPPPSGGSAQTSSATPSGGASGSGGAPPAGGTGGDADMKP